MIFGFSAITMVAGLVFGFAIAAFSRRFKKRWRRYRSSRAVTINQDPFWCDWWVMDCSSTVKMGVGSVWLRARNSPVIPGDDCEEDTDKIINISIYDPIDVVAHMHHYRPGPGDKLRLYGAMGYGSGSWEEKMHGMVINDTVIFWGNIAARPTPDIIDME
jgi:hypothetical protein